jgi:hypothetical protein
MSQPLISKGNLWVNFEKCVLETFILALKILYDKPSLPIIEDISGRDSLNRRLYMSLHKVVKDWEDDHGMEYPYTFNLKQNNSKQPDLDHEEIVNEFELKIPDFQWGFTDRRKIDSSLNEYFKNYDIECKRLGAKSLSKEYVVNGIIRFTKKTHSYGQYTSSGMMIGYIQDMNIQTILDEINSNVNSVCLPLLILSDEECTTAISRLDHKFDRPDIEPTPFELRHLWVDLRHHYQHQQPSSYPIKKASTRKKSTVQKSKSSKGSPNKDSSVAE